MKDLEFTVNNGALTVLPSGRIDSANAAAIGSEIDGFIRSRGLTLAFIDCSRLKYISSAGLRMILKFKKSFPALEITEVPGEIYDIFEMTGFTEMMTVRKAFRRIDVKGCAVIGEGANGAVYRLDPETIVKVFKDPDSLEDIRRERELARRAFVLGVPTAIPYDVVRVGEGYGAVYELLNAESFASILARDPERVGELAGLSVSVLKKLHEVRITPGEIPSVKTKVLVHADRICEALPGELAEKLVNMIEAVPDDGRMIHGDYHVKNIMLADGEPLLIDMDTLSTGHPVFELGNMFSSYFAFSAADPKRNDAFFGFPHELGERFFTESLNAYLKGRPSDEVASITEKSMIAGFTRVLTHALGRTDRDAAFNDKTIAICSERLVELLLKHDTLIF